jgi:hypothetical protein
MAKPIPSFLVPRGRRVVACFIGANQTKSQTANSPLKPGPDVLSDVSQKLETALDIPHILINDFLSRSGRANQCAATLHICEKQRKGRNRIDTI